MKILMVCTGNICRSPTAEGAVRDALRAAGLHSRVQVDSAGTHDYHIGKAPDPRTIRTALTAGIDLRDLRARQVHPDDLQDFSLILAMDSDHLRWLEQMRRQNPSAAAELRLFLDFVPDQPLRDMPDPYYGGQDGFDLVLDLCRAGAAGIIGHLRRQGLAP